MEGAKDAVDGSLTSQRSDFGYGIPACPPVYITGQKELVQPSEVL
jgi:hypothetical protein